MTTAIVHHPVFREHDTGAQHPERPERYDRVLAALQQNETPRLRFLEAPEVQRSDIETCHTAQHCDRIVQASAERVSYLDADTVMNRGTLEAALRAAGGACYAVDTVIGGKASNGFVPARPPGHHATRDRAMGFCFFNSVAIAARYAQRRYPDLIERVAIVDWDVHHGNGTQDIFYEDASLFFFSIHQYPWYPGTGARGETGIGAGKGYTLNVPVRAATPRSEHRRMFEAAIEEINRKFTPDLIIVSAGFDAHEGDPLGQLCLEDEDFVLMTRTVKEWAQEACAGRVISCLEGGYNLLTLGETVRAHVSALAE